VFLLNDVVKSFKERRKARLDKKAVEAFRVRRDARVSGRTDAEDEENNGGGGHGNTKIPFGLCQREGITIDPKWTPSDAWDALAGKGYSAGEVYKELKETGKVASKKPKKEKTTISGEHFPTEMMSGAYKKNTLEFAKYINEKCDDPDISELLSLSEAPGAKKFPRIEMKRSMDGEGCYIGCRWYTSTGEPAHVEVVIPQISRGSTPEEKAQAVRCFAHEFTHYIDDLARGDKKKSPSFSAAYEPLAEAIKANDGMTYGDEVRKVFEDYKAGYDEKRKGYVKRRDAIPGRVAAEMYPGEDWPEWLDDDGGKIYNGAYWRETARVRKFDKACRAAEKELNESWARERRAYMDGATNLQGIYDALSGGRLRARGDVKYGHSTNYYDRDPTNKAVEALADYVALRATRPDLADMFRRDKPDIAKALDDTIAGMVKRLRGAE